MLKGSSHNLSIRYNGGSHLQEVRLYEQYQQSKALPFSFALTVKLALPVCLQLYLQQSIYSLFQLTLCRTITKIPIIYEEPYAYSVFSEVK